MMRALSVAAALGAFLLAGVCEAESADWLARMAQAVRTQNYQGVMVYAQGGRMETMRIVHRYRNGREQERLQALSGDAREILRDDDVVTCILPRERAVKVDRRGFSGLLPGLTHAAVNDASNNYELQELGQARMLGRACRVVAVRPKDGFRYGYRMWMDEETSVPLKVELIGREGQVLEQVMFTQIEYPGAIHDSALQPEVDAKDFIWIRHGGDAQSTAANALSWVAGRLPPGFRAVVHELQLMPGSDRPVEHLVFTDGLATVSAFMAPTDSLRRFQGTSRKGAVNAYGKMISGFHVTVVGEVPRNTVELIANNLRYEPREPAAPAVTK